MAAPDGGMKKLGKDPATGLEVTLRSGRFGPYIQLGEGGRTARSPSAPASRRASRPTISISQRALGLLSLPREVGKHPEDGEPILAGVGRFGPYVQHGKTYANLDSGDDVLTVGLNRAVTLIAEKKLKPGKGRRFGADPGRVRWATTPTRADRSWSRRAATAPMSAMTASTPRCRPTSRRRR